MNRRSLFWGLGALVLFVLVLAGVSRWLGGDGAPVSSPPSRVSTSSPSGPTATTRPEITPPAADLKALSRVARDFAAVLFSYTPDDSPNAIKARASRYVVNPKKYAWRSPFTVDYRSVTAVVQPENITMEQIAGESNRYIVTMQVDRIERNLDTGQSFTRSSYWSVYFVRSAGRWLVEAEAQPGAPLSSSTPAS